MNSSESGEDKMDIDENEDVETEEIVIKKTSTKIVNENYITPTQVPKLKCDFSLTKTDDYCSKIDLPMHPSFFKNNCKNNTKYEKYIENLRYYNKKRERINGCFSGMWFAIWDTNEKTNKFQFKVGHTYGSVSSGCPLYSVVSFGCNQNYVFIKKEKNFDFVTDFSSQDNYNNVFTSNNHFVTRCNLHFVREIDESRYTVNGVAVLDNGASGVGITPIERGTRHKLVSRFFQPSCHKNGIILMLQKKILWFNIVNIREFT